MFQTGTLTRYVIAVLIVLAAVAGIRWLMAGHQGAEKMLVFSGGFFFGMVAMYIAMHVYRDDIWTWFSSR